MVGSRPLQHRCCAVALLMSFVLLIGVSSSARGLYALPSHHVVAEGLELQLVGNLVLPATVFGRGATRSLTQRLVDVSVADADWPWAFAQRTVEFAFAQDRLGLAYRLSESAAVVATPDVLLLVRALAGKTAPGSKRLELGLTYQTTVLDHIEATVPVFRRGRFSGWLRGSLIAPRRVEVLTGFGGGVLEEGSDPEFYLEFMTVEGRAGFGWSLGAGARYEADGFSVSFDVWDVAGRVVWPESRVRQGFANTRTQVIGPDGYFSNKPLYHGTYSVEPWVSGLSPHWEAVYEAAPQRNLAEVRMSGNEYGLAIDFKWRVAARNDILIGVGVPGPALRLGVTHDLWLVEFGAARWPPTEGSVWRVAIGRHRQW